MNCQDILQRGTQAAYKVTFAEGVQAVLLSVTLTWGGQGERLAIPAEDMHAVIGGHVFTFDTSVMFGVVYAETEYIVEGLVRKDKQPIAFVKDRQKPVYIVQGVSRCGHEASFARVMEAVYDYLCDTDGVRLVTSNEDYIIVN